MERRSVLEAGALTGGAAVVGNVFIGKAAMAWFRGLTAPRWQLPLPAFLVVGALYYGIVGYVLARSLDRRDARSTAWSLAVLVGNEAWNGIFFGRRSARAGFVSLCAYIVPLVALQRSVAGDAHSRNALAPYTAYVLVYDLPWTYQLWRLNPTRSSADGSGVHQGGVRWPGDERALNVEVNARGPLHRIAGGRGSPAGWRGLRSCWPTSVTAWSGR